MKLSKVATAVWMFIALWIPVDAFSEQKFATFWHLSENQPSIQEGGQANTIAVNPENRLEMLVASEGGGLFKSVDGGHIWKHIDYEILPAIFTQSVAYVGLDSILVSAKADFKTKNGGGVWRSVDGGSTWAQVTLPVPANKRVSAYGISGMFGLAVVGTSEGVFLTTNGGETWLPSNASHPFPAGGTVFSVQLLPGNPWRILAGGRDGVRVNTFPFGPWTTPSNDPGADFGIVDIHAFGWWPLSQTHAFVVNNARELFRTETRGNSWAKISSAPVDGGSCGGRAFIKTRLRDENGVDFIDLFFGNRCRMHRLAARIVGSTASYPDEWEPSLIDRPEPRDLALFDTDPVLLATNGGLHNTVDDGVRWRFVGGGRLGGYNALQITDVKGQLIEDTGTTDLYFGTQDNKLWSATVWADIHASLFQSGFFIEAERKVPSKDQSKITFMGCAACRARISEHHFDNDEDFDNAEGATGAPVLIRRDQDLHHYVQNVPESDELRAGLALTEDTGTNWQQFGAFPEEPRGIPRLARAGTGDHSIFYQSFRSNLSGPPSEGATRLMRIQFSQGNGVVVYPAMAGLGGLGVNRSFIGLYPVYGVDTRNAFHVIAPDHINRRMVETWNGGEDWSEIPELTNLVTQDGDLLFRADLAGLGFSMPLVTAVSFGPDPRLVLIGTREGGIFFSGDRGATWKDISDSDTARDRATHITSFYWHSDNIVYVSSFGRGLWKLWNRRVAVADAFDDLCLNCEVVANDSGPSPPPFGGSFIVFHGRIRGVRTDNGLLREVFVTPGSSVVFTGDQKDPQDDIAITESDGRDTTQFEPLPKPPDGWIVTGVVFTSDDLLTGTAFAQAELSMLPPEFDGELKGSTESPTKGTPYIRLMSSSFTGVTTVAPQEVFDLSATDFVAGASYEVLVDDVPLKDNVTADGSGCFTTRIAAPSEPGYYTVAVRMTGEGTAIDSSEFLVRN